MEGILGYLASIPQRFISGFAIRNRGLLSTIEGDGAQWKICNTEWQSIIACASSTRSAEVIPESSRHVHDETGDQSRSDKTPDDSGEQTLSPRAILLILTLIALACIGGYFLLMELIDISRQEDCLLAGRRNCAPIEVPSNR